MKRNRIRFGIFVSVVVLVLGGLGLYEIAGKPTQKVLASGNGDPVIVQTTTLANTSGEHTIVDNALLNKHPEYLLQVTQVHINTGAINKHPIGVRYRDPYWLIFNEDKQAMPIGSMYDISFSTPQNQAPVYSITQIQATTQNDAWGFVVIDNPISNTNANATLYVTQNGTLGTFNPHHIGVQFALNSNWTIFNEDSTPIPFGASFNVEISHDLSSGFPSIVQQATGNTSITYLSAWSGQPDLHLRITQTWNIGLICGCTLNNHAISVAYDTKSNQWAIYNNDFAIIKPGTLFFVTWLN